MSDIPRRRNGLDRPYSTAQIAAGIAMVLSILQYAAVVAPILRPMAIAPVTLVFVWTIAMVLQSAMATMLIDPIDMYLCRHLQRQQQQSQQQNDAMVNGHHSSAPTEGASTTEGSGVVWRNPLYRPPVVHAPATPNAMTATATTSNGTTTPTLSDRLYHRVNAYRQSLPLPSTNENETGQYAESAHTNQNNNQNNNNPMKHCWICDVTVSAQSMHCKFCNKCVANFDHHCMWLNTCVGQANYVYFFRTLWSLCAMQIVHFSVQLYLVIDILQQGPDRVEMSWISVPALILVLLVAFLLFNCFSLALIGQLIVFHLSLQRNNLTTYEFIVRDHQEKRLAARREGDIEAHRTVRMAEAQVNGQGMRVRQLQLGGLCRQLGCTACDPLDIPQPPPEPDPEAGFASVLGAGPTGGSGGGSGNGSYSNSGWNNASSASTNGQHDGENDYDGHSSTVGVFVHQDDVSDRRLQRDGSASNNTTTTDDHYRTAESESVEVSRDDRLVDLMYEAGMSMSSIPGSRHGNGGDREEDDDEDPDDPSNGGHDDSLADTDEGSPIKEMSLHSPTSPGPAVVRDFGDSAIDAAGEEHAFVSLQDDVQAAIQDDGHDVEDEEDEEEGYDVENADVFDNEPDDMSQTSGCSTGRGSSTKNGERDYTAF